MSSVKTLPWLLAAALTLSTPASADMQQLRELFRAGDSAAAYQLALSMLDQFEGNTEFDFIFGASAVDNDQLSLGVFALERAHAVYPDDNLIKLELARGYFLLGITDRALTLFDEVLAADPPLAVRQRIEGYKQVVTQVRARPRHAFSGFVAFGMGQDSNANSGPDTQPSIVSLSAAALESSDQFAQTRAGVQYTDRYTPGRSYGLTASLGARQYQTLSSQDYTQLSLGAHHDWIRQDSNYRIGVNLERYTLDDHRYRDLTGIYGRWEQIIDEYSRLRTTLSWTHLRFPDIRYRDFHQWMVNSTYFRSTSGDLTPTWYAGILVGQSTPDNSTTLSRAEVERDFWGINLGVRLNPTDRFSLTPGWTYQDQRFAGQSWLYGTRRHDRYSGPSLSAQWKIDERWMIDFSATAFRNRSNFDLYNYDRQQYLLSAQLSF